MAEEDAIVNRDAWIPHPEQRETVPHIELYSVLVGNLPSLPSEVTVNERGFESMGFTRRQTLDWQIAVTVSKKLRERKGKGEVVPLCDCVLCVLNCIVCCRF